MPNINLRLTPEEHAELEAWAHDGHRSIQKEIIWRLFTVEGNQAPKVGPTTNEPRHQVEGDVISARHAANPDLHFKPDFKKPKK